MNDAERAIRRKLRDNFPHYASKCLKIRSKSGALLPLQLNTGQMHLHNLVEKQRLLTGKIRAVVLKGRQIGCSSYIEGRFYWRVTHSFGVRAFILTHDKEATKNLFEMAQRYHENCPLPVRPSVDTSNANELLFAGLDSGYRLGTAGNKAVGRSSTIQLLHSSEVAYQPNSAEHAKGIMQAVSNENGTEIFLESTANGIGNYFHEQWQQAESGESEFIPIFIPWYWQPEYKETAPLDFKRSDVEDDLIELHKITNEQLMWRRKKIIELSVGGIDGSKAFLNEYPFTSHDAFASTGEDTFIDPIIVMHARKCNTEKYGALIVGCDPARFGDDRTSIIRRSGRVAYGLESYRKKDTMEVAGILHRIIIDEQPNKLCIDIGGLGAGVYDRLVELGHRDIVVAVNAGATPLNQKRYYNKRAEMWGLTKEWLQEQPVQIPDSDSLHADLCAPKYTFDSKTRLKIERKEDMKKRGIRSPDEAESLILTFSLPDTALLESRKKESQRTAQNIMSTFNKVDRLKKAAYK